MKEIDLKEEQEKFAIFKSVFEKKDNEQKDTNDREVMEEKEKERDTEENSSNRKITSPEVLAEALKAVKLMFLENRKDDYGITEEYYPHLLNEMSKLGEELKLKNSLELSNLFTYLLWNGYLSKTKENIYRIENRKLIEGLFFADIMDGVGVCLNHADMLKDFLNNCGYKASLMINLAERKPSINYRLNIERKAQKSKIATEFMTVVLKSVIKRSGNHAFTLIEDNGMLYVYDSTNLVLLSITDPYTAELINGKGIYKLRPYLSCALNTNHGEKDSISSLFMTDDFISPYSRKDLIFTGEENMELFMNRTSLIEDFYDEVRSDLINISEATDKIKVRKKKKNK